jgi:hypothetical protein
MKRWLNHIATVFHGCFLRRFFFQSKIFGTFHDIQQTKIFTSESKHRWHLLPNLVAITGPCHIIEPLLQRLNSFVFLKKHTKIRYIIYPHFCWFKIHETPLTPRSCCSNPMKNRSSFRLNSEFPKEFKQWNLFKSMKRPLKETHLTQLHHCASASVEVGTGLESCEGH